MHKSESIKDLAAALNRAQGAFEHAKKEVRNEFFKSKYADLSSVIDAAKKPLFDNGLAVTQVVDFTETGDMVLETMLMHTSGQFLSGKYPIKPVKQDPQSIGSSITYARRYAFSAITGIAADDDDGNAASGKGNYQQPQQINYKEALEATITPDQLAKVWGAIPSQEKTRYTAIKDAMKQKLTENQEDL